MDDFSILPRRQPTRPMGYLKCPPKILNKIYHGLSVDDSQILLFL